MEIFLFDKDRDNIASSMQIGFQKKKKMFTSFKHLTLSFDMSAYCLYIQISKNALECSKWSYEPI